MAKTSITVEEVRNYSARKQQMIGEDSNNSNSSFEYYLDEWERSPKTDYTYARTLSYNRNYKDSYVPPNMSRPSLHGNYEFPSQLAGERVMTDQEMGRYYGDNGSTRTSTFSQESLYTGESDNFSDDQSLKYKLRNRSIYLKDDNNNNNNNSSNNNNIPSNYKSSNIMNSTINYDNDKNNRKYQGHSSASSSPYITYEKSTQMSSLKNLGASKYPNNLHRNQSLIHRFFESTSKVLYSFIIFIGGIGNVMRKSGKHLLQFVSWSLSRIDSFFFRQGSKQNKMHIFLLLLSLLLLLLGGCFLWKCRYEDLQKIKVPSVEDLKDRSHLYYKTLQDKSSQYYDKFQQKSSHYYEQLNEKTQGFYDSFQDKSSEYYQHLHHSGSSYFQGLKRAIGKVIYLPILGVKSIWSNVVSFIISLLSNLKSLFSFFLSSFSSFPAIFSSLFLPLFPTSSSSSSSSSSPVSACSSNMDEVRKYVDQLIDSKRKLFFPEEKEKKEKNENEKENISNLVSSYLVNHKDQFQSYLDDKINQMTIKGNKDVEGVKEQLNNLKEEIFYKLSDLTLKKKPEVEEKSKNLDKEMESIRLGIVGDMEVEMDRLRSKILREVEEVLVARNKEASLDTKEVKQIVESSVQSQFDMLIEGGDNHPYLKPFMDLLVSKMVSKEDFENKQLEISKQLHLTLNQIIDQKVKDFSKDRSSSFVDSGSKVTMATHISEEDVEKMIREALFKYDADKTGLVDFALESAGGSVVGTRCSKTYKKGMAQLSVFGIPLWYANNSPRTVIQPGNLPGQCWPFVGSVGYVVLKLSTPVFISMVSVEHVSKQISTFINIDSAPKDFSIWGLSGPEDVDGVLMGNFTYDAELNQPLQYFNIEPKFQKQSYLFVEFRVYSNHGNPEYTCLYRVRVHGEADLSKRQTHD